MEGLKFEYKGTTYNVPCMPNKYWREALLYYGDCPARLIDCQDSMCYCCIYHRGNQKAREAFYYECFPEEKPVEAEKCRKECANYKPKEEPKKRPKLTQEVFDRPDCPEWAEWAVVEGDGKAFWFSKKPKVFEESKVDQIWYCPGTKYERIDGEFDASTWRESLIKKPCYPEYTFLTDACPKDLVERVNNLIKEGWYPLGGVAKNGAIYMQTLMKEKED